MRHSAIENMSTIYPHTNIVSKREREKKSKIVLKRTYDFEQTSFNKLIKNKKIQTN
jgi:hypothetical protein